MPGPFLAPASFAYGGYARLFAAEPEEREAPGFFTDGLYAASPVLFDSGNAALLAFRERFRARHGHEPSWRVVLAYDATRMLLGALAAALPGGGGPPADTAARRRAVRDAVAALDGPARAFAGVSGPIWFDAAGGRPAAVRMARFDRDLLESAPLQLVPVANPDLAERVAGTVVPVGEGRFARLQRVVYAGIYLNEMPRVDLPQSSFIADFYFWLRSAARPGEVDASEIQFPDMRRGDFDPAVPAVRRDLPDGSVYRLWHVRGEFRNEFDLHRFPFDRQTLALRLFNTRGASDRIVYARGPARGGGGACGGRRRPPAFVPHAADVDLPSVSPAAFRGLTQWQALRTEARRDVLVTPSALGDPLLIGAEQVRELSGFRFEVGLRRRTGATLVKSLLPIGLMTLMMFASLWFPPALVRDKVVVAITGALSGAVLLASINNQLGNVAYTMDIEYAFYVFFALALLCILSVSLAEQLRVAGRQSRGRADRARDAARVLPRRRRHGRGGLPRRDPVARAILGHAVQQRTAFAQPPAVLRRERQAAVEGAGGQPADVRRQHHVRQGEQGVRRVHRLVGEDVEPRRGEAAAAQRLGQRRLVHQAAARRVHQHRAGLHAREGGGVDHALGLRRQRQVQRDDVGLRQQRLQGPPLAERRRASASARCRARGSRARASTGASARGTAP